VRALRAAVLLAAGALAGGALAWGHGAAAPPPIHACTTAPGQPILLAETSGGCPVGQTPLTWSVQGPTGPRGATGARGATGPTGAGSTTVTVVQQSKAGGTTPGALDALSPLCPKGQLATGGGYRIVGDFQHPRVLRNTAVTSGLKPIGWTVWAEAGKKQAAWTVVVTVACVK
jgi:hypothetical protein